MACRTHTLENDLLVCTDFPTCLGGLSNTGLSAAPGHIEQDFDEDIHSDTCSCCVSPPSSLLAFLTTSIMLHLDSGVVMNVIINYANTGVPP